MTKRMKIWGLGLVLVGATAACTPGLRELGDEPGAAGSSGSSSGSGSGEAGAAGETGVEPEEDIVNPGGCETFPDMGRDGNQPPGPARWVPDCEAVLLREYWRVLTEDGVHAYTLPRIDFAWQQLAPVCEDETHALHPLVELYQLCTSADTEARVDLVNSMALADALELTHYLHQVLRFEFTLGQIQPYPFREDLRDACQLADNSAELTVTCEQAQQNETFSFASPGAEQLVERLNQLYGVH